MRPVSQSFRRYPMQFRRELYRPDGREVASEVGGAVTAERAGFDRRSETEFGLHPTGQFNRYTATNNSHAVIVPIVVA